METYGIFYQIPPGTEPTELDRDWLDGRVLAAKRFLDFYNPEGVEVRGFFMEGTSDCGQPVYGMPDIEKYLREQGDGYDPKFTQAIDQKPAARCGEAVHGGPTSAVFKNPSCREETTVHEFLHSGWGDRKPTQIKGHGCAHSSRLSASGRLDYMGDHRSVMGSNGYLVGMTGPHICWMGWNKPEDTIIVTEPTAVLLAPIEMQGLHPNERKHVILRVPGHNDIHLETRLEYPFQSNSKEGAVYVVEMITDLKPSHPDYEEYQHGTILHDPRLMPGDVRELPNGMLVKYVDFVDGIASLLITPGKLIPWPRALQRYKGLPSFGPAPEAGTYYNPVSSGHGIDVQVNGDIYTISWFTGNEANDFPRWYTAAGKAGETMVLRTTVGGTPWDPTQAQEIEVGEVRLTGNILSFYFYEFDDDGEIIGRRRGGIEMTQLVKNQGGGMFYDKARSGEGINVIRYPDFVTGEPSATVILWTYGKRKLGVPHTEQRFFTFQGKLQPNGAYALDAVAAWGEFQRFGAHIDEAGDGELVVIDQDNIRFAFRVDGRDETYSMERLV